MFCGSDRIIHCTASCEQRPTATSAYVEGIEEGNNFRLREYARAHGDQFVNFIDNIDYYYQIMAPTWFNNIRFGRDRTNLDFKARLEEKLKDITFNSTASIVAQDGKSDIFEPPTTNFELEDSDICEPPAIELEPQIEEESEEEESEGEESDSPLPIPIIQEEDSDIDEPQAIEFEPQAIEFEPQETTANSPSPVVSQENSCVIEPQAITFEPQISRHTEREEDHGLRRSTRARIPPVEFERGQRAIYSRDGKLDRVERGYSDVKKTKKKQTYKKPKNAAPPIAYECSKNGDYKYWAKSIENISTGVIRIESGQKKPIANTRSNAYRFWVARGQATFKIDKVKILAKPETMPIDIDAGTKYSIESCSAGPTVLHYVIMSHK